MAHAEARYGREEDFHNAETTARWNAVGRFYDAAESSLSLHRSLILEACQDAAHVLDYGCGDGELSVLLAERASRVTGIDISERRIEAARDRAKAAVSASQRPTFAVMNAEQLAFADNSFDVVCGTSILHHLDLDRAVSELARVLKPNGTALFVEPLGHNPLINAYRKMTPSFRTPDEHPLLVGDFEILARYFEDVGLRYFHLMSLAAVPARKLSIFPTLVKRLDAFDQVLFARMPFLRRYAWIIVLSLRRPAEPAL